MIEQIGIALSTQAYFSTLGVGTESLVVTVDVRRNGVLIVTGASVAEIGGGFYGYTLDASYNTVEGIYTFLFKTTIVTVDQQQLVGAWYVGKAGVENLDASIAAISTYLSVFVAKSSEVADIPALKTVMDQFRFTVANQVDANALTGGGGGGTGAIDWSDQFIVTVDGLPRDGVFVRFTTDAAMLNIVATGTTNAFGKLDSLMLDAGMYYVWLQLAGVNFSEPAGTEVVA